MPNVKDIKLFQKLESHTSDVTCLDFLGNMFLVTGSSDKTVRLWKWVMGSGFIEDAKSPLIGHRYGVTDLKISPQGKVLASSSIDGSIILWDLNTGEKIGMLHQENNEAIRSCTFSPNGAFIAGAGDNGAICIWDKDKTIVKNFKYHEETVYTINFSPDSKICLSGCSLGNLRMGIVLEGPDTEFSCGIDNAHDLGVQSADFCKYFYTDPNDTDIKIYTAATCGNDHYIKIWRIFYLTAENKVDGTRKKSKLVPLQGEHDTETSRVFNTSIMNAECVLSIQAHSSSVTCVKFNFRATVLFSCGLDSTIKVWNLQGHCLQTLTDHTRYVNCITSNEDVSILASGSNDRSIIIWDLTSTLTLDSNIAGLSSMLFNSSSNRVEIPFELICPISHEVIQHPVVAEDGFTYERSAIEEWFENGRLTSPMTNAKMKSKDLSYNDALKVKIDSFLKSMDFEAFQ